MSAAHSSMRVAPAGPAVTRFAPSPSGELHLGNARTALFNVLLARSTGGRFLLRIEDTDATRSRDEHADGLLEDLRWLGLQWDAGPGRDDGRGPYRQALRTASYEAQFRRLEEGGHAYPCFCTQLELDVARRTSLAAGRPPRYAGTCRELPAAERARRIATGARPTLRFRVPAGRRVAFDDFVHGPQSFLSDDIGDFIVRRADGSAAFFFCNAVDDAAMGVTHVLRGEDHLANTPRQLLLLEALGCEAPAYGHVSLLVGRDGAPLSKRHGATSVRELRERGFLPEAVVNHLFRLGHGTPVEGLLDLDAMARAFDTAHLGRAPSLFDEQQLLGWQKEAAHRLSPERALEWLARALPPGVDGERARAFVAAVRANVVLPADAALWADVVFREPPAPSAADEQVLRDAGPAFFAAAAGAAEQGADLPGIVARVREATGRKGQSLWLPLRLALTGLAHGPELGPLLALLPPGKAFERFARRAAQPPST